MSAFYNFLFGTNPCHTKPGNSKTVANLVSASCLVSMMLECDLFEYKCFKKVISKKLSRPEDVAVWSL